MDGVLLETWLYYWDARDGSGYQGWWIAPEVGSDLFMAFAPGDAEGPELCRGEVASFEPQTPQDPLSLVSHPPPSST